MRRPWVGWVVVALVACVALSQAACGTQPAAELTPVTLQLAWTHQAQFAGFYAAEGGPSVVGVEQVLNGSAQFAVIGADVLVVARSQGKGARAVAAIYRRSPRVYMSLRESAITKPEQFIGKTISLGRGQRAPFDGMMRSLGISADQYTVVDSTAGLDTFYSGQVQVRGVYLTNEVLAARAAGHPVDIVYPDDYGIHNYGDVLIASDVLLAKDPDLARRFVRASLKGWSYAVEHPTDVGPMVKKYNPTADVALENDKMLASIPLVNTGEDFVGWMRPEMWSGMEHMLQEQGALAGPVDPQQVYTMEYVSAFYK
jgi:NitT/TauT family transport system substrate-binding protein